MRIRHILPESSCRQEEEGEQAFFLANPASWFSLYGTRQSRYEGWYLKNHDEKAPFTKVLEHIEYVNEHGPNPGPVGIINTDRNCFWEYGDGMKFGFQLTEEGAGLTITTMRQALIRLVLDIRGMYQQPEMDRKYILQPGESGLLLKYSDPQQEAVFLHIRSKEAIRLVERWEKAEYPRDAARHSPPTELYVFVAADCPTERLDIGAGFSAKEALDASEAASRQNLPLIGIGISHIHNNLHKQSQAARATVRQALSWLQSPAGLYAGLPWFHQVWSRDELIAAVGLTKEEQLSIINRYLRLPLENGELPTFLGSGTTCADGVGWLSLLIREYGLSELPETTLQALRPFLETAYRQLKASRQAHHGLIWSGHNATWMDTIGREGFRLEIQCMFALVLELLASLTKDEQYEQERIRLLGTVYQLYFRDHYLWDGLEDPAKRPNVFLAYLLQPDLMSQDNWARCFSVILDATYCEWGGLSSLDRTHPDYRSESTGQDNLSYHNGDSWFFINNLAGLALYRFGKEQFRPFVLGLLAGSTNETLWKNMVGMPGEIASSKDGASWGCGIQAFSGGTYLALVNEVESYWEEQLREEIL